jgi:type III secretory pathway component EscT
MLPTDMAQLLGDALGVNSAEWQQWARAWARVTPLVVLVPAFGLRAVPPPMRAALGLSLAVAVAPLLPHEAAPGPWSVSLLVEFLRGIPVAVVAATALWAASMAGGLIDQLRGAGEGTGLPNVESGTTPTGTLLSMLLAIAFLKGGGAAQAAAAVARSGGVAHDAVATLIGTLTGGVSLAVAVAAPVVAVAIVVEVASALVARAANPAFIVPTLAPLRSLAILAVTALLLDRMAAFLMLVRPP